MTDPWSFLSRPALVPFPDYDNINRLDLSAMPMVNRMQQNGIRVDVGRLRQLSKQFAEQERALCSEISQLTGHTFNIGSPDQIAHLLFAVLRLPKRGLDLTPSGRRPSVDAENISKLSGLHPAVEKIVEATQLRTLCNNYTDKFPHLVDSNSRIHTNLGTTRQKSGRISSSKPNLSAVSKRTKAGKQVRSAFIASPGKLLGAIDLSQIELRIGAHESLDPAMLAIYKSGGDIHDATARAIFQIPEADAIDDLLRYAAKRFNFGIFYRISAYGLVQQIRMAGGDSTHWTEERCSRYIDLWMAKYSGVAALIEQIESRVRRYGCVWSMHGRIRRLFGARSPLKWIRNEALRQAVNHPFQAGGAECTKLLMADLTAPFNKLGVAPLHQIHDEILVEFDLGDVENVEQTCLAAARGCCELAVPLDGDFASGERWSDLG